MCRGLRRRWGGGRGGCARGGRDDGGGASGPGDTHPPGGGGRHGCRVPIPAPPFKLFGCAADCGYAGGVMKATPTLAVLLLLLCGWPGSLGAQGTKQVKVVFEFRQSGTQSRKARPGSGRVVLTARGGTPPSGRYA